MKLIQHNINKNLNKIHHIPADFLSPFTIFSEQKSRISSALQSTVRNNTKMLNTKKKKKKKKAPNIEITVFLFDLINFCIR